MKELSNRSQISIKAALSIAWDHDVAISSDGSHYGLGASSYLGKIAEILGSSIEDLMSDGRSLKHSGQVELLRLWSLLPDDAARLRVLELARTLAASEGLSTSGHDEHETGERTSGS